MSNGGFTRGQLEARDDDSVTRREFDVWNAALGRVEKLVEEHDARVDDRIRAVTDTIAKDLSEAFQQAFVAGMWHLIQDPDFRATLGRNAAEDGKRFFKESVGGFMLSRWAAIAVLVVGIASYIGWPTTLKWMLSVFGAHSSTAG